jgi:hypothetical protein
METRTRFDLNAAVEDWRKQLMAQPGLTPDNRRELEGHLHDSIAALRQGGLADEESFWLARRRVGHPQFLAQEFAKEDPAAVWRERLFWLAIGLCVMRLWSGLPVCLLDRLRSGIVTLFADNFHLPDWILFYVPLRMQWVVDYVLHNQMFVTLFRFAPLVYLVLLFARGRMGRVLSAIHFLFGSRTRFLLTAAASLAVYYGTAVSQAIRILAYVTPAPGIPSLGFAIQLAMGNAVISALIVGLIIRLMPVQRSPATHA